MHNFTREDIHLEAIRIRIARMSDGQLVEYGKAAAYMARASDRATWRVPLKKPGRSGASGMPRNVDEAKTAGLFLFPDCDHGCMQANGNESGRILRCCL